MHGTRLFSLLSAGLLASLLWGGQKPADTGNSPVNDASPSALELGTLRDRIAHQAEQIRQLQETVEAQAQLLDRAIAKLEATPSKAGFSTTTVVQRSTIASAPPLVTPAFKVGEPVGLATAQGPQNLESVDSSPLGIHIGSTRFTPFGFVDFTWFGRSKNVGSGIGTNFGGVPYNDSAAGHISENNFSAQNSRIGFRVDSTVKGANVLGYFEADFLGTQPANIFVSSNANTFRMRNVFVDVQKGKWEFLGGQDWSMLTPNRKGLSPVPADIFYTLNMDTNYQAGLVWSRQSQFRLTFHPNKDWHIGVSLENPQQYIGGSGGLSGAAITLPAAGNIAAMASQFNNSATTIDTVTGAQNFGTPNLHPDVIVKAAYDGHRADKLMHLEAAALVRTFKGTYATAATPVQYNGSTTTAVSGSVNANVEIAKDVRFFANTFFGEGGGRYVFGLAPDIIIRPDGMLSPVHTYSTLDGIEANPTKNTLFSAYYGGVYIGRQTAIDTNGHPIGYGFSGSSNNDNRTIQEFTFGLTQTFWKSANYGSLSLINQYSFLTRNPWSVATGAPKAAHSNLYYVNLRYTLP